MKIVASVALVSSANAIKGKCPFGFTSGSKPSGLAETEAVALSATSEAVRYPSHIFKCANAAVSKTDVNKFGDDEYEAVVKSVLDQYEELKKTPTPAGEVSDEARMAGCLLRFAGHDLMDYRVGAKDIGGSDGCVDFSSGDNAGLQNCLISAKMPEAYAKHCDKVSLADFTVIAAEAVMGRTSANYTTWKDAFGKDSLLHTFRENFLGGRETSAECPWSNDRMPDAEEGIDAMRQVFFDNIFANSRDAWRYSSALIGAHTLGSASIENSGYDGSWSNPADQGVFNNGYYKSLLLKGWGPETGVNGNKDKNQWVRVDRDAPRDHKQMMLNTDMAMVFDQNTPLAECINKAREAKKWKDIRKCNKTFGGKKNSNLPGVKAQNVECCAWISTGCLAAKKAFTKENIDPEYCGLQAIGDKNKNRDNINIACCEHISDKTIGDCDNKNNPQGPGYKIMAKYVASEEKWLDDFSSSWKIATTNGHSGLRYLDQTKADPQPILDECASKTKWRSCMKESEGLCMWKKDARVFKNRRGKTIKRGGCAPYQRDL